MDRLQQAPDAAETEKAVSPGRARAAPPAPAAATASGQAHPGDTVAAPAIASDEPLARVLQRAVAARALMSQPALQRMAVRGKKQASVVSNVTLNKHVQPLDKQEKEATDGYGSRTFVTAASTLTAAVDADGHNFTEGPNVKSARFDLHTSVPLYQYDKTEPLPGGNAAGQPVKQTIAGATTSCEIGVTKTGADILSIMHFKKT